MGHYKHWIRGPKEWGPKDWESMDWGSMDQAPEDLESLGCMAVLLQDRNPTTSNLCRCSQCRLMAAETVLWYSLHSYTYKRCSLYQIGLLHITHYFL